MDVLVGVSGGVDSAYALMDAQRQGFSPSACLLVMQQGAVAVPSSSARARAQETAAALGVELIEEDVTAAFAQRVVEPFMDTYERGFTPNPCVACNRDLKVASLLAVADRLGIEKVMTGHYARLAEGADGVTRIARAQDATKDQSYFLGRLEPAQVERLIFPTGELTKAAVRKAMAARGLAVAYDKDSLGVCFAPHGNYQELLREYRPHAFLPGPIIDTEGKRRGTHRGIGTVTVGQRKGLGLAGGPWFVQSIDAASATVVVERSTPPLARWFELRNLRLTTSDSSLIAHGLRAQTHYRAADHPVYVELQGKDRARVTLLDAPTLAAPGQSVVFYCDDVVMGEGTITSIQRE